MNGHASDITTNGFTYDHCGYEEDVVLSDDTRNVKWQAKTGGQYVAAANKSYNYKGYAKHMRRKEAKIEREIQKANEIKMMQQIQMENNRWAPVDKEDA